MNQMVIPVFYELDPSHVKKQTGEFGKAFDKTCEGKTEDEKQRWVRALAEIATIAGYDSRNWTDDSKMIEEISKDVLKKLLLTPGEDDFRDFVGIGAHVEAIMDSKLCLQSEEVRMVGILGPSGIGKTTIARALYSRLSSTQFDHRTFASYKRAIENKKVPDVIVKLAWAQQFLSEILCQKDIKIESSGVVEQRLKHRKVLIVLDDVDEIELLETLVGKVEWFGFGSRIIVVTQDKSLLEKHKIDLIYEVEFPSEDLALQMFCQSAFGQTSPSDGFMKLAAEVARLAGNLPLGLNVLGLSLRGRDKKYWVEIMPKLRNGLNGQIDKTLRISYDGLDENDYKDMFLYIACLFNGETVNNIKSLLPLGARISLTTLAEKSLIRLIGLQEAVQMHILLQKLGKQIVREESIHNPGERRFLIDAKDIYDVFEDDTGTNKVLGIYCNTSELDGPLPMNEKSFQPMPNLQFLKIYKDQGAQKTGEVSLDLPQGLIYLPRKLRLLYWDEYPAKCIPSNFKAEHLVELTMEKSKLEKLWERTQPLRSLKKMNLCYSRDLKIIPNLSDAKNLDKLVLNYCKSLVTLPSSIWELNKLTWLWMRGCKMIEVLPTDVNLKSLYALDLRGCSRLRSFPRLSTNISLLLLDGTSMEEEDCLWIENLATLIQLHWKNCPLRCLLPNFNTKHLHELVMEGSKIEKLWEGFKSLGLLGNMDLSECKNLKEIPDLSTAINLVSVDLSECESLKDVSNLSNATNLQELSMGGCTSLEVLPTNINLRSLTSLSLRGCSRLTTFPRISTSIRELHLSDTAIEEVPSWIGNITGLVLLWMRGCKKLRKISATIWNLKRLRYVDFTGCEGLTSVTDASMVKTVHSFISYAEFLFFGCFNLDLDAQKFILQSDISFAALPGKQVPTYYTHRTCGSSLTVPIPQSSLSQELVRLTACIVSGPETDVTEFRPIIIVLHIKWRGLRRMVCMDPVAGICEMDHMAVFRFGFCPEVGLDDFPSQLECNNVECEFEVYGKILDTDRLEPCKIKECGVRVLDVSPSLDFGSKESEWRIHVLEHMYVDPVIVVEEDTEIPSEDTNYLRLHATEDVNFTLAKDEDNITPEPSPPMSLTKFIDNQTMKNRLSGGAAGDEITMWSAR